MSDLVLPGHVAQELAETRAAETARSPYALSELAEEFHFFNHGAFFAFTPLEDPHDDPVNDWYAQMPSGTEVIKQPYSKPVFDGLEEAQWLDGRSNWNHLICAVRKHAWDLLFPFLGGATLIDRPSQRFYQPFTADVKILDPGLVERYSVLKPDIPTITVTLFGIDSNAARWEPRQAANRASVPVLVKMEPRRDVVEMAKAVLSGQLDRLSTSENPAYANFMEQYRKAQTQGPDQDWSQE